MSGRSLVVALSVAALVGIPAVALGATGNFSQPPTSPETAGPAPLSVTAAKLNSDANFDLAVTDFVSSSVSILLGDGNGNFTPAATSPETSDGTSNSVAAGNFNGDANTDLAVANLDGGDVTILLGSASGDFTEPGTSPEVAGTGPISIAAANLGGDANIDLAVLNNDTTDVTILLGDGSGSFTVAPTSPETVGGDPRSIVAARFNGDANTDLAVANRGTDNVTVLLGSASGDFAEPASSEEGVGDAPSGLATGNFGGDGNLDLAVANRDSDNVSILLGNGTGNFTAAGTSPEPVGNAPRSLVAASLGGSVSTDLAVANAESDNVSVLLGNGAGNFTPARDFARGGGRRALLDRSGRPGGDREPRPGDREPGRRDRHDPAQRRAAPTREVRGAEGHHDGHRRPRCDQRDASEGRDRRARRQGQDPWARGQRRALRRRRPRQADRRRGPGSAPRSGGQGRLHRRAEAGRRPQVRGQTQHLRRSDGGRFPR